MSCTVTIDGPCRRTLSFEVERERLQQAIDENIQKLAQTANLKGFRKGKAPVDFIRKTQGAKVEEEVRREIMNQEFSAAVQEHSLHPVGEPEMNLEKLDAEGPGPFTFELAIETAPDFEPDVPEEFAVTVALAAVTDEMVKGQAYQFREQGASLEDAPEGAPVAQDDILEGTVVYEIEGEALEARADRAAFTKHDIVDSIKLDGSGKTFISKVKGDTLNFDVTLPEHFAPAEHAGKEAKLAFTIDRHRLVILPELNEEFLSKIGVKTEEEMIERIREELVIQRARSRDEMVDGDIEKQILERNDFELPARLLSKAIESRVHEFAHRIMKERGLESEDGHHQAEERREEIAEATTKGLRVAFLLSRIAEDHDLKPSAEDTINQVKGMAAQQQKDPDELLAQAQREGWLPDVYEQLMHQNARAWLRELAKVTESEPEAPSADE